MNNHQRRFMKYLNKSWKEELDEYERVMRTLSLKNYSNFEEWGKSLEQRAAYALSQTESTERAQGVKTDLSDFLYDEIKQINLKKRARITFKKGTVYIDEYKIIEYEPIDFSKGKCYLAAVEIHAAKENKCEFHFLIGQEEKEKSDAYFYLTLIGKNLF